MPEAPDLSTTLCPPRRRSIGTMDGAKTVLRLISWNVNGLRAVHRKGLLDWVGQASPDILCLQETKVSEEQLPEELREVAGYTSYFAFPERKGYSGVALYTRSTPQRVSYGLGIETFDREARTIVADYGDFVLLNLYFPNGRSSRDRLKYKMEFYDAFLIYADDLRSQGKQLVVCGDVNTAHKEIDLARPKQNERLSGFLPQERAWIDKLLGRGYMDTFRMFNDQPDQYTYWDQMTFARERNVGWRIDYFFVSEGLARRVAGAHIFPEGMGSDHCPIGLDITL